MPGIVNDTVESKLIRCYNLVRKIMNRNPQIKELKMSDKCFEEKHCIFCVLSRFENGPRLTGNAM